MPYTNPTQILQDAVKFPQAIEAALPTGAPKISEQLTKIAGQLPAVPDFPIAIPDLPAPPKLPTMPTPPTPTTPTTPTAGLREDLRGKGKVAPPAVAAPGGLIQMVFE
jgi:hypothetical protein